MHLTTNHTIEADLRASLAARGVSAGRTLGSFIEAALRAGATLADDLAYIEFGVAQTGNGRVVVTRDEHGALEITEGRHGW